MKIFLSGMEGTALRPVIDDLIAEGKLKYNLMSYWYLRGVKDGFIEKIRDNSEEILIDSGAHSFQFGTKTDFETYTREYAAWIKEFDRPNVVGYFEMDIDNVVGYEKVLELRKILEEASDKIIPVWHVKRGIDDYKQMCKDYAGKVVAITGFANKEITDDQYIMFLKVAKQYGCKLHCLGMTRKKLLDKVPFDYVDSASWLNGAVFGHTPKGATLPRMRNKDDRAKQFKFCYNEAVEMQSHYYKKWRKICKD